MTLNVGVTDDQLGQYFRRTAAIADRLGKSLSFERVMEALQLIHDGRFANRQISQLAESTADYTRVIPGAENLVLDPTDGTETIAQAADVFSYIDPNFKNWDCDVPGQPTGETVVTVHELIKDGDYHQIFGSLASDPEKLCLEQFQIKQFVQKHRHWLRTDSWATFFLFKSGGKLFVADVYLRSGGKLYAHVYRFSHDSVWRAAYRYRVVVPQLALGS